MENYNRSGCGCSCRRNSAVTACYNTVLAIIGVLFAFVLGLIIGAALFGVLLMILPVLIAIAVILAVLFVVFLIIRGCTNRDSAC